MLSQDEKNKERVSFAQYYDAIPCGIAQIIVDKKIQIINVNSCLIDILGYSQQEFSEKERFVEDFIDKNTISIFKDTLMALQKETQTNLDKPIIKTLEFPLTKKDGDIVWVKNNIKIARNDDEQPIFQCAISDINQQKKAEQNLKLSEEQYRIAVQSTKGEVFVYDIATDIATYRNPKDGHRASKGSPSEYIKRGMVAEESIANFNQFFSEIRSGKKEGGCEFKILGYGEKHTWFDASYHLQYDINGKPLQAVCVFADITVLKNKEHMLYEISRQDALTGLLNRSAYEEMVENILERNDSGFNAFLMLDLDSFKNVNDIYGHAFGDELLICASDIIRNCARKDDIIARLGGDEFAIFMCNIKDEQDALLLGARICKNFEEYTIEHKEKVLSCSVGVAISPLHGCAFRTLYDKADIALYNSKNTGKSRCCIYTGEEADRRDNLFNEVRNGFDDFPIAFTILEVSCDKLGLPHSITSKFSNKAHKELFKNCDNIQTSISRSMSNEECSLYSLEIIGEIAFSGGQKTYTKYSEALKKWLFIQFYQPLKGFCACIINDITNKIEEDINFKSNEERLRLAIEYSSIYIWEYDALKNTVILPEKVQKALNVPEIIENVTITVFNCQVVDARSIDDFVNLHTEIAKGAKEATADVQFIGGDGRLSWQRLHYKTVYSDKSSTVRAVGFSEDINDIKASEGRFEEENAYRAAVSQDLWASAKFNLTQNIVEDFKSDNSQGMLETLFQNIDEFGEMVQQYLVDEGDKEECAKVFATEQLLNYYNEGRKHIVVTHVLAYGNNLRYLKSTINLIQRPTTGDIIAFVYAIDITDEQTLNRAISTVIKIDYDYIAFVDTRHNSYVLHAAVYDNTPIPPTSSADYNGVMTAFNTKYVVDADRERVLEMMRCENMLERLEKNDHLDIYFTIKNDVGDISRKKVKMSYLDKTSGTVLITRTDVTTIYKEIEMKNTILRDALLSAEQANNAKTEFLSHMSHEIRTPMNAILGMTSIAQDSATSLMEQANCLTKIRSSANFLLALVNNILDMSKIESGNVLTRIERINFSEFINNINNIISESASAKGIEYKISVVGVTEMVYLGDALKLEQILLNVLSNAIKFTQSCGKVRLTITQIKKTDHSALLQFVVSDTGRGISQDFLPHIFEPFAQEQGEMTIEYAGTGLGLAITKNLVALMDGKISVKSQLGVGTEFTVQLPLGLIDDKNADAEAQQSEFCKATALIVNDNANESKELQLLLSEKGLRVSRVDSCRKAIDYVAQKFATKSSFDFIIVDNDIKDGGNAVISEIRQIADPEETVVILSAYKSSADEKAAFLAGANLVATKPILRAHIYEMLKKARANSNVKERQTSQLIIDFTGKRVLLVEDHPINVEVTVKLLERKNCVVETARNGLLALEKFAASPSFYYDAILMDIRMPIMDGLTATKKIRELDRLDNDSVPIIAMTANAFDADFNKSEEAGMNSHLNKPIEPELLYNTLAKFILKK